MADGMATPTTCPRCLGPAAYGHAGATRIFLGSGCDTRPMLRAAGHQTKARHRPQLGVPGVRASAAPARTTAGLMLRFSLCSAILRQRGPDPRLRTEEGAARRPRLAAGHGGGAPQALRGGAGPRAPPRRAAREGGDADCC